MNSLKKPTLVYIVENSGIYARLIDYIFSKDLTHRFVHLRSGEECMGHLDKKPELILIDQTLPAMNGLDTIRAIREKHQQAFIVITICDNDNIFPSQVFEAGADDYIIKENMTDDLLVEKIENYLRKENLFRLSFQSRPWKLFPRIKQVATAVILLLLASAGFVYSQ